MADSNTQRTIFIGDVHGCYDELCELLEKCDFDRENDEIIFVGDLINKGPHSLEVLQLAEFVKAQCVIGNHELAFIKYAELREQLDPQNYPEWEDLIIQMGSELVTWVEKIDNWPAFIETSDYIVVHGGLIPGKPPSEKDLQTLTRIRTWDGKGHSINNPKNPPWHDFYEGEKTVIYGHWAAQGLHVTEKTVGLDSGCVYGGELSAYLLPEKRIVQVKAKKAYTPIHPKSSA